MRRRRPGRRLARNVARLVQVSTPDYQVGRGLTVAEAHRLLAAAEEEPLSALYVVALYLGLRRAELLGLRWSNVVLDPPEGRYPTLEIAETLQRLNGELRFAQPKTRRSRRVVPLPPVCVEVLRAHRDQQAKQRLRRAEIGETMIWSSRPGSAHRWSRTTCAEAGTESRRRPACRSGFTISGIPA